MATVSPSGVSLAVAEVLRIAHQDAQAVYRDLPVNSFRGSYEQMFNLTPWLVQPPVHAASGPPAAARVLSGFKITLTPCPDGWHVDYDLTDPLSAGGGPHYVIHPDTGDILARRYEQ